MYLTILNIVSYSRNFPLGRVLANTNMNRIRCTLANAHQYYASYFNLTTAHVDFAPMYEVKPAGHEIDIAIIKYDIRKLTRQREDTQEHGRKSIGF